MSTKTHIVRNRQSVRQLADFINQPFRIGNEVVICVEIATERCAITGTHHAYLKFQPPRFPLSEE